MMGMLKFPVMEEAPAPQLKAVRYYERELNIRIAADKLLKTLDQEKGAKHHDSDPHIRV
jgi:hypothetical protein